MAPTSATIEPKILYFGTPVVLLTTINPDGSANLAPMSSAWALGWSVVLGLGLSGQTMANLRERPDLTISLPGPGLWEAVERLAPLTGRDPVPETKRAQFRHRRDKFEAAGLTPVVSDVVAAPGVAECSLRFEAQVAAIHSPDGEATSGDRRDASRQGARTRDDRCARD